MNVDRLSRTIDALSKVINITSEQKEGLISKCSSLDEKEVIKALSLSAYREYKDNEEVYTYCLETIRNIDREVCPSVEEMKTRLDKMYSNQVEGNMSLEDNHRVVNEALVKYTRLLNEAGIDYYVVGALPCFIKTGEPLFRYHDDIDIMINEDDIDKVAEIVAASGYEFHDDRFLTLERAKEMDKDKPPHTVLAQDPNSEFHLGFFTFRREEDNSITVTEYSYRIEGEEVVVDVLERKSDPISTELRYDDTPTEYMGTSFRTGSVEEVYILKGYTNRPKDITDMKKLEPYIDKEKVEEIKKHPLQNELVKNVSSDSLGSTHK